MYSVYHKGCQNLELICVQKMFPLPLSLFVWICQAGATVSNQMRPTTIHNFGFSLFVSSLPDFLNISPSLFLFVYSGWSSGWIGVLFGTGYLTLGRHLFVEMSLPTDMEAGVLCDSAS